MKKKNVTQSLAILIGLLSMFIMSTCNIEYHVSDNSCVKDLDGSWKFSLGDSLAWANQGFDDSNWDNIDVPKPWEEDGYVGYDGFAWYRLKLNIPSYLNEEVLFLDLGQIDDVDETFLNGHRIGGTGTFPPNYRTAYNENRHYYIPKEFLNKDGDNVIAVRVFDEKQAGGFVNGRVGICTYRNMPEMLVSMEGAWKFSKDDDLSWAKPEFNDSAWVLMNVPNTWESQGFPQLDGFGWYRHQFEMSSGKEDNLVLMLGNIDDIEQVYLNGKLIGSTGEFGKRIWSKNSYNWDDYWSELRGYEIPEGLLKPGKNYIAVRVFDQGGFGGIYNGPLGILSLKEYKKYKNNYENYSNSNFFSSSRRIVINTFKN